MTATPVGEGWKVTMTAGIDSEYITEFQLAATNISSSSNALQQHSVVLDSWPTNSLLLSERLLLPQGIWTQAFRCVFSNLDKWLFDKSSCSRIAKVVRPRLFYTTLPESTSASLADEWEIGVSVTMAIAIDAPNYLSYTSACRPKWAGATFGW